MRGDFLVQEKKKKLAELSDQFTLSLQDSKNYHDLTRAAIANK